LLKDQNLNPIGINTAKTRKTTTEVADWREAVSSPLLVDGTRVREDCASDVGTSEDRDGFVAIGETCISVVEAASG